MTTKSIWRKRLPACLLITAVPISVVLAQSSGGDFEITRHTIDNGGGLSTGGGFELVGSIAQPDASLQTASGGDFQVTGGFWANGSVITPSGELLFSDSFESSP